ncbi:zinc ABC transporter substrate-binding protein ZnuA [Breoghania sp. L-A4]|uniref:zinc ABC transporter substrate-binding protein ZnuA n=1 Tax=Breoghania sp. L-A4 TaxID=2304600 RepID=UPI000E35FDA5|nr:zinc ABC transporter substrate-binding protein ZnuA [Breoghania sp. L-A4]AXS41274.1 zinc ABC transporter substrate-binding protein ZnuA [Breoghania sp. L-A4]
MTAFRSIVMGSAALLAAATHASAADPAVLASIKPIHSLVASVMQGVGEPAIIVDGAASPHTYSLKPSQARDLQNAAVVFWVGHELEAFLEKPLESLATDAAIVELMDTDGLTRLAFREGGAFEAHADEGEHEEKDDHGNDETDPHIWLDPHNAKVLAQAIEEALARADPENAIKYEANADALMVRLDDLTTEVEIMLAPVREKPFVVFHDGYHYFENRFGLQAAGSVTVSPDAIPGAARVVEIRHKIEETEATCVFAEPQFEPKLISVVTEGTEARSGTLDPLGATIANGPDLYFTLIRQMAKSLGDCLSGKD